MTLGPTRRSTRSTSELKFVLHKHPINKGESAPPGASQKDRRPPRLPPQARSPEFSEADTGCAYFLPLASSFGS